MASQTTDLGRVAQIPKVLEFQNMVYNKSNFVAFEKKEKFVIRSEALPR
jgi:hypothetical protein